MTTLITNKARAYVNFGRWVSDCPMNCGSAMQLEAGQAVFQCVECKYLSDIEWPDNADEIWVTLSKRPANKFRNWFPKDHELAIRSHCPHGQSVKDLEEENQENGVV